MCDESELNETKNEYKSLGKGGKYVILTVPTPCIPHPLPNSVPHAHTEITATFYDEPTWGFTIISNLELRKSSQLE